jgi:hypothetical protein
MENDAIVRFRLPQAQKDEWDDHAETLTDSDRSAKL